MSADAPLGRDVDAISRDTLLHGRLHLFQPRRGHRAGTDALILAASASAGPGETIIDVGAATGAVGMIVALRCPQARLVLVERDEGLAALARENLALNGLAERAEVIEADVIAGKAARRAAGLHAGLADLVVTNPPFSEEGEAPRSPEARRAAAHELPVGGFVAWIETCGDLLAARGRLVMIQRADRLPACLSALAPRFGSVRVRPVHPKAGADAIRVVVDAVKGGRGAFRLAPPLVLHEPGGEFSGMAQDVLAGTSCLTR